MRSALVGIVLALGGCSGDDGSRGGSASPGIGDGGDGQVTGTAGGDTAGGPGGGTASGTGGTGGTSADAGADGSTGDGPKFDLPPTPDVPADDGCQAIDFMFVIDNSISMSDQQTALKAAFPLFMATISETLPTTDYQIMVVDTDAAGRCAPGVCTHATCQEANQYACGNQFVACDTIRGAGVVHPAGQEATNGMCSVFGNNRYIIEGEPDLSGTFSCMASVGLAGHQSERPMDGMVEAVSPALLGPGGCNTGFIRDDAILVVTFLSDDPNVEDQNTAQQTYDALVAAKNGNADAIVMLGLTPGFDGCTASAGAHWAELIGLFGESGFAGSICEPDYAPFFDEAVGIIADTCQGLEG